MSLNQMTIQDRPIVPLCPELAQCIYREGLVIIEHPLLKVVGYSPQINGIVNEQLRAKKEALGRALAPEQA